MKYGHMMKMFCCSIVSLLSFINLSIAADVAGGRDHPEIGRFQGSEMTSFKDDAFGEYEVATGPGKARKLTRSEAVEGRKYSISYELKGEHSIAEVFRNYELRLQDRGFDTLYKCEAKECGRTDFRYSLETIPSPHMQIDGFKYRYIAARKLVDGIEITATILVSMNNNIVFTQVIVVEAGALENKIIDATQMQISIGETGRIALYGIFFDFDKATLKPESKDTLDEIAKLLLGTPELRVFVVGHTDNQGSLEYNTVLSKNRANSVVKQLTSVYGVAKNRIVAAGVGFLSPLASNNSEEGRAKNRRVELVQF